MTTIPTISPKAEERTSKSTALIKELLENLPVPMIVDFRKTAVKLHQQQLDLIDKVLADKVLADKGYVQDSTQEVDTQAK